MVMCVHTAFASPDFDGDGYSDPILVQKQNKNLDWFYLSSEESFGSTEAASDGDNFGKLGNDLAPAYWTSTSTPVIGYVSSNDDDEIVWTIPGSSANHEVSFGASGDTVVSGGDFDGNGISDAAYARTDGTVRVRHNMFGDVEGGAITPTTTSLTFAKRAVRKGTALYFRDGSGTRIGFVIANTASRGRKRLKLVSQNMSGTQVKVRFKKIVSGAVQDVMPIANADGTDSILVVARARRSGRNQLSIFDATTGALNFRKVYRYGKITVVGNFMGDAAGEIGLRSARRLSIVQTSSPDDPLIFVTDTGVLTDQVNVNAIGGSGSIGSACSRVRGIVNGRHLWKPESDHTNDNREGKPLMIFRSDRPNSSCLDVYASNGQKIAQLGRYPEEQLYGRRFYTGYGCGTSESASKLSSEARAAAGSTDIYVQGNSGECFGPITPTQRQGGV